MLPKTSTLAATLETRRKQFFLLLSLLGLPLIILLKLLEELRKEKEFSTQLYYLRRRFRAEQAKKRGRLLF